MIRMLFRGALAIGLALATSARACTTFCLRDETRILYGRNFDYYAADGRVIVNRRGVLKSAFGTGSALQWVSRFGSVSFEQFGCEFPNGGMNEAGLVIEHMMLDGSLYPNDACPSLSELQWIQYQLDGAAAVAEVIASDARVRIATNSTPLHFLVADRSGDVAVIEYLNGRMIAYRGETLPVAAITNHRYDVSLAYAATTTPAAADRVSSLGRFVHAAEAVRQFAATRPDDAITYAFNALANVAQPSWTRWSIVYDLGELAVHFRTEPAAAIKTIRLVSLDFRPDAARWQMDINAIAGGEVVPATVYSRTDNLAVLTSVYRQTAPLAGVSASYLASRASYPDSVTVAALPVITRAPESRTVEVGEAVELSVAVSAGATLQWQRNGRMLAGGTQATWRVAAARPEDAGVYTVVATNALGSVVSEPAIVGVRTTAKVIGSAYEYAGDIRHAATGNTYDQFLATGGAASLRADPGQIARISFIDLNDDIVQVEFYGSGTLSLRLEDVTGPATPRKYNQEIAYVRGHATVVVADTAADTCLAIYSVGALTNPAVVRAGESYDGHADLALVAIQSGDGRLSAIRCGNASFWASAGATGVWAPGVIVEPGPVNLHEISAADTAIAYLAFGDASVVRIAGGDLYQMNGGGVRCTGLTEGAVVLAAGTSSGGVFEARRPLRGRLLRDGFDVSAELVVP